MTAGRRSVFFAAWLRGVLAAILTVLVLAGCGSRGTDVAAIPPGLEAKVESARDSVSDNWDGFGKPWFAFVQVRCRADGGVVIVFAEQGFGADGDFAYALQGGRAIADGWGGGLDVDDPDQDEEIIRFFDEQAEVICPTAFSQARGPNPGCRLGRLSDRVFEARSGVGGP